MKSVKNILILFLFSLMLLPTNKAEAFAGEVTSRFGWRIHPIHGTKIYHSGVDIAAAEGTPLPSLCSGVISSVGYDAGYGNYVEVEDASSPGHTWLFAHCAATNVQPGQPVSHGQVVAFVGNTGASTGAHVHVELNINGNTYDPINYVLAQWSLTGYDPSSGHGNIGVWGNIIPSIDFDFTNYFAPSEMLLKIAKSVLALLQPAMVAAANNLKELLVILCIVDLSIFLLAGIVGAQQLDFGELIPKAIRYGFFFFLLASWRWLITNMFVPFVENISSTYSGQTFTESGFLCFDQLFVSVTHVIKPFLHVGNQFDTHVKIILIVVIPIILLLCLFLTFTMIYKLIAFYMMCVFGAVGIPLLVYCRTECFGKNIISAVFTAAFDLIISAFLYSIVMAELLRQSVLDPKNIAPLVVFTVILGFLSWLVPVLSAKATRQFSSLL